MGRTNALAALVAACAVLASACEILSGVNDLHVSIDSGPAGGDGGSGEANVDVCPTGLPGAALVDTGRVCIDSTEATQHQYQQFLDSSQGSSMKGMPPACSFKTTHQPGSGCLFQSVTTGNFPVECVDWCDAWAYCAWAGKRLCGKFGGGSIPLPSTTGNGSEDYKDPQYDEWFSACSHEGDHEFPYGGAYAKGACNDAQYAANPAESRATAVGVLAGCEGGFAGLFDMSGNVAEWEDSACEPQDGGSTARDACLVRGGSYQGDFFTPFTVACDGSGTGERGGQSAGFGIRCCVDRPGT